MNQVGVAHDDQLEDTHQKFRSIQFHPVGVHERSDTPIREAKKLVEPKEKPQKRHGFDLPLHPLQIGTFLLFGYNILMFYIVIVPYIADLDNKGRQAIAGIFGAFYVILIGIIVKYTYQTTITDPTDKTVYLEREAQLRGYDVVNFDVNNYEYFCNVCKTHVLEHTKHCQQCNRCVQNFDHHCPWLNNCIGGQNYRVFIKMLSWVTFSILYQIIAALICFLFKENFQSYSSSQTKDIWVLLVVNMAVNFPVLLGLIKLLSFHIYLIREGMSTYQHILQERERATQQKQQSKVILQVGKHKDDIPNLDHFQNSSPRYSSDDTDKQKTKDMSERNQFVLKQPVQKEQLSPEQATENTGCFRFLKVWGGNGTKGSDKLPKSIKVQPINNLAPVGSDECIPRSQSQIDDHMSGIEDDGPAGLNTRFKTHQQQHPQMVFTQNILPPLSNRSKTSKYDSNQENRELKQKNKLSKEESLKLQPRNSKKSGIILQNPGINDQHLYDVSDSYRYTNKFDDILKADQLKLENKTSSKDRFANGRSSLQDRIPDMTNNRMSIAHQTPLIGNNLSRLSVDPSIHSSQYNANLKQALNNQLYQGKPEPTDAEIARKNSRNMFDGRGNSDMQSAASKKRPPYEHKSLA